MKQLPIGILAAVVGLVGVGETAQAQRGGSPRPKPFPSSSFSKTPNRYTRTVLPPKSDPSGWSKDSKSRSTRTKDGKTLAKAGKGNKTRDGKGGKGKGGDGRGKGKGWDGKGKGKGKNGPLARSGPGRKVDNLRPGKKWRLKRMSRDTKNFTPQERGAIDKLQSGQPLTPAERGNLTDLLASDREGLSAGDR